MRAWADVAVLSKSKNSRGRFVVRSTAGLPFLLERGDEVAFVPPQTDLPRRAIVGDVRMLDETSADIQFEGMEQLGDCEGLVGCHCLIKRDLIGEEALQEASAIWEGWTVVDEDGVVGVIVDVIDNPAQKLLEVERQGGATVLIPAVDEIVLDVDVESRRVQVDLPNGLLDL